MKVTLPATTLSNFDPATFADELAAAMGSNFGISTAGTEITTHSQAAPDR